MLSSSGAGEDSFVGGGTAGEPAPSVFTAAIIETLSTGSAGSAASGYVSVDELFDAVGDRLRQDRALQKPVKSALAVDGRIDIARRPHGKAPELTPVRRGPAAEQPIRSEPAAADPDWPTLLAYYRDAVQGEADDMPGHLPTQLARPRVRAVGRRRRPPVAGRVRAAHRRGAATPAALRADRHRQPPARARATWQSWSRQKHRTQPRSS